MNELDLTEVFNDTIRFLNENGQYINWISFMDSYGYDETQLEKFVDDVENGLII